eukprot:9498001-Pyramimonas_sp.AAC.1
MRMDDTNEDEDKNKDEDDEDNNEDTEDKNEDTARTKEKELETTFSTGRVALADVERDRASAVPS